MPRRSSATASSWLTGGTAKALRDAGHDVLDVSDLTGFPEMMDVAPRRCTRRSTAASSAVRDDAAHVASMKAHGIGGIDRVVVNLYPSPDVVMSAPTAIRPSRNIDIGGPAMVRSSAKNHAFVGIVTEPEDYVVAVIAEMDANGGATTLGLRKRLAATAFFAHTATYDSMIAQWFAFADQGKLFPDTLPLTTVPGRTALWRKSAPEGGALPPCRPAGARRCAGRAGAGQGS